MGNVAIKAFHIQEHENCELFRSSVADGEARVADPSDPARLKVRFSPYAPEGSYNVLETDYLNYAVVYSCEQAMFGSTEYCWILTRDKSIEPADIVGIKNRIKAQGIDTNNFEKTDHKGCPEWTGRQ